MLLGLGYQELEGVGALHLGVLLGDHLLHLLEEATTQKPVEPSR